MIWQINVGKRDELVVNSDVTLKLSYVEDKEKERKLLQIVHECESSVQKGTRNSYIVFVVRPLLFVVKKNDRNCFPSKFFHVGTCNIMCVQGFTCGDHKKGG